MKIFSREQFLSLCLIHMCLFNIFVICFEQFGLKLIGFFEMILKVSKNIVLELKVNPFLSQSRMKRENQLKSLFSPFFVVPKNKNLH